MCFGGRATTHINLRSTAFGGMTSKSKDEQSQKLDSSFRWNDGQGTGQSWTQAFFP
jgi:hypothetical protein